MTGPEHNPRDDEQDEEELFVLLIAELVQAGKISMAKIHLRSYIDYVNKSIAYGRESERAGKERVDDLPRGLPRGARRRLR